MPYYYIAFKTIVMKELLRFLRIWLQTIIPPAIMISLYFIIFGKLIGSQIDDMNGVNYMQYIVPGLVMMVMITNAYSNVVSSFFSAKFQRHIEEMLVSPIPNAIIIMGFMMGGICRGLMVGFVVTCVALLFVDLKLHNVWIMLSMAILTTMLFSIAGLINAIFAKTFDDITIIPTFVLTPLTYLGGIFYSIELLPEFWQNVSLFNPILYMINAFRYGVLGVSDISVDVAFMIVILFTVVLFGVALQLLNKGIGIRH